MYSLAWAGRAELVNGLIKRMGGGGGGTDKPPCDKTPLFRLNSVQSNLPSFSCECRDRDRQINSLRCILCTLRRTKSHNLMNTLNTSSDDCSWLHFIPCLLMTPHKMTVYDISLCRHTLQTYSLWSFSQLLNIDDKNVDFRIKKHKKTCFFTFIKNIKKHA